MISTPRTLIFMVVMTLTLLAIVGIIAYLILSPIVTFIIQTV